VLSLKKKKNSEEINAEQACLKKEKSSKEEKRDC
jgi:hypothetical protein